MKITKIKTSLKHIFNIKENIVELHNNDIINMKESFNWH